MDQQSNVRLLATSLLPNPLAYVNTIAAVILCAICLLLVAIRRKPFCIERWLYFGMVIFEWPMTIACYLTQKNTTMSQIMKWILVANSAASLIFSVVSIIGNCCCSQQKQVIQTKCNKIFKNISILYNFRFAYFFSIPTAGLQFLHGLELLVFTTGGLAEFSSFFDQYIMVRQTVDFQMAFAVYFCLYLPFTAMFMKFAMYGGQQYISNRENLYHTQNTTVRGVIGSQQQPDHFGALGAQL